NIRTGLSVRDARTKSLGTLISRDKVRSISAGGTYDWSDDSGALNLVQAQVSKGIPILGNSENNDVLLSRANGRTDFSKATAYISRTQSLDDDFSLFLASEGQWAFTQMLALEEFSYGGAQFGRGYDGGEISGDHGVSGLIELRRSLSEIAFPPFVTSAQIFSSYDFGATWRIDVDNRQRQLTGASVAAGLRFKIWDTANLELQLAAPLTRGINAVSQEDSKDWRGFLSFNIPW
ncbi:MAG: hypothetical protein LW855_08880, partial [Alphaproteobacteria bacterium]|nr:hypothetical protein [Alphaproteobacteria bacterium]